MSSFEKRTKVEWRVSCSAQPLHNSTLKHAKSAQLYAQRLTAQGLAGVRITEHKVTTWVARVRMRGFPAVNRSFATRKDAEEWARVTEGEMARRQFVDHRLADRTSLAELLRKFDETRLIGKPADHPDRSRIRVLTNTPLAKMRLSLLQPQHFAEYRDRRLKLVKGTTVRKELELFARVIGRARREWGLNLPRNPASGEFVSRPNPEPGDERDRRLRLDHSASPQPLDPVHRRAPVKDTEAGSAAETKASGWVVDSEIVRWMQMPQSEEQVLLRALRYPHLFQPRKPHASAPLVYNRAWRARQAPLLRARDRKGGRHWVPVSFGLETAMRRGELSKVRWEHAAADFSYLLLPGSITKNGKERIVPMTLRARRILSSQRLLLGRAPRPDEPIFGFSVNALKLAFERARERAGATDLRFHDLRHEATSVLFERTTLRETEIGSITGHTDPRMLQRYYNKRAEEFVKRFHASFVVPQMGNSVSTATKAVGPPERQPDASARLRDAASAIPDAQNASATSRSGITSSDARSEATPLLKRLPQAVRANLSYRNAEEPAEPVHPDLETLVRWAAERIAAELSVEGMGPPSSAETHAEGLPPRR